MKILHVIHRFVDMSQGGGELYTAAMCRHLVAKHEVAVLYTFPVVAEGHLERATLGGLTTFVLFGAPWQEAKLQSGSRTAERAFGIVLRKW